MFEFFFLENFVGISGNFCYSFFSDLGFGLDLGFEGGKSFEEIETKGSNIKLMSYGMIAITFKSKK